jgi:predicted DCC family thiol-disulfide oxidoreductase YuxK
MDIVFFDGECGVCNRFVQFLLDHDKSHRLHYAPLQGETARARLSVPIDLSTIIFLTNDQVYYRSDAVLKAIVILGDRWSLVRGLLYVPKFFRDFVYILVARMRHRIPGASAQCRLLSDSERQYFLP